MKTTARAKNRELKDSVTVSFVLIFTASLCISAKAAEVAQDNWGRPNVRVLQEQGQWIIQGDRQRIQLKPADLQITIKTRASTWSMIPSYAGDLVVENAGKRLSLRLAGATKKAISPYDTGAKTGLKITLEDFQHDDSRLDLKLSLFLCLEGKAEDLVCELLPEEKATAVQTCFWPQALAADSFDSTIVPFMQGMLLPKDWAKKVWLYASMSYGRGLYMPWSLGKGAWGIPETDLGYLHGLANAGLPYVSLNPDKEELIRVRTMAALHKRVGLQAMTDHQFLDDSLRKQRTTFADGTTVTIDLDTDTFEIEPKLDLAEEIDSLPPS